MANYYWAAAALLLLNSHSPPHRHYSLSRGNNNDGGTSQLQQLEHVSYFYCQAFAPPPPLQLQPHSTKKSFHHKNNNQYSNYYYLQRKSDDRRGVIGGLNFNSDAQNNNKNEVTVINSTNKHDDDRDGNNNKQPQRRNDKMRQDHDGALLWTSRRNLDVRQKHDDRERQTTPTPPPHHYNRRRGRVVVNALLDEDSLMDENDVEDVASLLMEQPPNLNDDAAASADALDDEDSDVVVVAVNDEYDTWRQEKAQESVLSLSLAEKRARIKANAAAAAKSYGSSSSCSSYTVTAISTTTSEHDKLGMSFVDGGSGHECGGINHDHDNAGNVLTPSSHTESVLKVETTEQEEEEEQTLPKDVGVLFVNGVTDDSPIAHAASSEDEALLNDAESVLDIINEAEAAAAAQVLDLPVEKKNDIVASSNDGVVMAKEGDIDDDDADIEKAAGAKAEEGSALIIPPALNSIVDSVTSHMPSPPQPRATNQNSERNSDLLSTQHLSEINAKLEETLRNQKSDLGRLRKKINMLQGEILQANREATKNVEDLVNSKMAPLREECTQQVIQANEAVALLEEQVETLTRELGEQTAKYDQTLEDKERIAAEYGYVVKSYMELKRSLDTNTNDWQEKLQKLTGDTQSLEQRMVQYQEESKRWKNKCIEKANLLDESTAHIKELQSVMDGGLKEQENIDDFVAAATKEERARSKDNLQRLSDEYEVLLSKKSKKIGELRTTLRSANAKRHQVERHAQREKSDALKALRLEMSTEIDSMKTSLQEKEDIITKISQSVQDVEVEKEEKERVYAELMFLSKSFKALQSSLESSKQNYEERIQTYEDEAAAKEKLILDLRKELELAQEKIISLEAQVSDLSAELVEERRKNENLTAVVTSLTSELDVMRSNAAGFEDIIAILRSEKDAYERQLAEEQDSAQSLKEKKDDLEDLIRKTKDSLVMEKERVAKDMSEKDSRIAQIDRDLAEQMNENKTLKKSLKHTTDRYNSEKARVERLNAQLQRARRNLPLTNADHADEIEMFTSRINELSKSKDEYKSILSNAESKMKVMTQQLLLSNQHVLNKQSEIARLKKELSALASTSTDKSRGTLNDTISALTAELEELKSSASMQKATANEKLMLMNVKLEEKEADVLNLQNKIKELVDKNKADREKKRGADDSEVAEILELKSSIATLQTSLKDVQVKAKEKIQLKNQSLKDKEDTIEKLKAEMIDLKSSKDKIAAKLNEQMKRSEDEYRSHELQIKRTEDKLAKENLAAINAMEKEMKDTVYQLEMEVKMLKRKISDGDRIGSTAALAQAKRMQDLENALRQSKEQKVSLLNENMKMKHRIDNLQFVQAKASKDTVSSVPMKFIGEEKQKDVPSYFQDKKQQRPLVVRVVGNAWKKVFSRKKL
jgi:chromosome segregation ATPase